MAEARAPQKSLPKINPVDRPFWEGAAKNKFLLQKINEYGKYNNGNDDIPNEMRQFR